MQFLHHHNHNLPSNGNDDGAAVKNNNETISSSQDQEMVIMEEEEDYSRQLANYKFCSRGHWKPAEDAKLKELVSLYGPQNWNLIAQNLQGRSGKSCRLRWFNQLDPKINKNAFSEEEEERLMAAHRIYGNKWALIARIFPGRTDNSVKNHWHVIMARKYRRQCFANYKTIRNNKKMMMTMMKNPQQQDDQEAAAAHNGRSSRSVMFVRSTNYECLQTPFNFFPGCSDQSIEAAGSQVSSSEPSSSISSLTFAENNINEGLSSHFQTTISPPFIDFFGLGA